MNPAALPSPDDTLTLAEKLYHSGAFFALGIFLAYYLLRWLDQHVAWFEEGKRAAYTAAGLGALAVLAVPASQGTTPSVQMLIMAALQAASLLTSPTKQASSARTAQAGRVALRLLPVFVLGIAIGGVALESCTKVEATIKDTATCAESAAVKDIQPTVQTILTTAGDVWMKLLAALESALGPDLVDCAVTAAKNDLLAKQAASPTTETAVQRADQWLGRHKSSMLKSDSPEWRGREPAIACVAGWIPEADRKGHPVCPAAMSTTASAE